MQEWCTRILVTGASGFIGSALATERIAAGHQVVGLARSDAAAAVVENLGALACRGSLEQPESICEAAAGRDAVAHLGFSQDFSRHGASIAMGRRVIEALLETCAGTHKPLVITSGTALVAAPPLAAAEGLIRAAADRARRRRSRLRAAADGAGAENRVLC